MHLQCYVPISFLTKPSTPPLFPASKIIQNSSAFSRCTFMLGQFFIISSLLVRNLIKKEQGSSMDINFAPPPHGSAEPYVCSALQWCGNPAGLGFHGGRSPSPVSGASGFNIFSSGLLHWGLYGSCCHVSSLV